MNQNYIMENSVANGDIVQLMEIDQFKGFSINLNAHHVNGMIRMICTVIRYSSLCIMWKN